MTATSTAAASHAAQSASGASKRNSELALRPRQPQQPRPARNGRCGGAGRAHTMPCTPETQPNTERSLRRRAAASEIQLERPRTASTRTMMRPTRSHACSAADMHATCTSGADATAGWRSGAAQAAQAARSARVDVLGSAAATRAARRVRRAAYMPVVLRGAAATSTADGALRQFNSQGWRARRQQRTHTEPSRRLRVAAAPRSTSTSAPPPPTAQQPSGAALTAGKQRTPPPRLRLRFACLAQRCAPASPSACCTACGGARGPRGARMSVAGRAAPDSGARTSLAHHHRLERLPVHRHHALVLAVSVEGHMEGADARGVATQVAAHEVRGAQRRPHRRRQRRSARGRAPRRDGSDGLHRRRLRCGARRRERPGAERRVAADGRLPGAARCAASTERIAQRGRRAHRPQCRTSAAKQAPTRARRRAPRRGGGRRR